MKKTCCAAFLLLFLSGCAAPRFDGSSIDKSATPETSEVEVVMNTATRSGFLEAIEEWLSHNGYNYIIVPDNAEHQLDKITLEYFGRWSWDLAIFLSEAEITAFHQGQRVGHVQYRAPNTINPGKFGEGSQRVHYMMDVLFGRLSSEEAGQLLLRPKE